MAALRPHTAIPQYGGCIPIMGGRSGEGLDIRKKYEEDFLRGRRIG